MPVGIAAVSAAARAETPAPLVEALAAVAKQDDLPLRTCETLARAVPSRAGVLVPVAVRLRQRLVQGSRDEAAPAALAALPEPSDARGLETATMAVSRYRELAKQRPADFLVTLAFALLNRSRWHGRVGNLDRCLADADKAVEYQRAVVANRPAHRVGLVEALTYRASRTPADEIATLRATWEEIVACYELLAVEEPGRHIPAHARALFALADVLKQSGRRHHGESERRREEANALLRRAVIERGSDQPVQGGGHAGQGGHEASRSRTSAAS